MLSSSSCRPWRSSAPSTYAPPRQLAALDKLHNLGRHAVQIRREPIDVEVFFGHGRKVLKYSQALDMVRVARP
jgi:hypothetical protein